MRLRRRDREERQEAPSASTESLVGAQIVEGEPVPQATPASGVADPDASDGRPEVLSATLTVDAGSDGSPVPVDQERESGPTASGAPVGDSPNAQEPASRPEVDSQESASTTETPAVDDEVEEVVEEPEAGPAIEPDGDVEPDPMVAQSVTEPARPSHPGSRAEPRPLPRVIAIANQKGGVGKTTTTVNLGAALAELSYRVLVIDLDPQGNATTGLGIDGRNFEFSMYDVIMRDAPLEDCIEPTSVKNLFVAPATIDLAGVEIELVPAFSRELKLKRAIDAVVDDFDFILIDCPPSLGLITVNGLAAAGEVLVPIQCEYYALEGLSQLLRNVQLVSTNLNATLDVSTIVLTMYDARTRLAVDVANEVRQHFADKVCQSIIPRTVRLSEAPSFGQPITVFDPTSRGAIAYRELAKEVSNGAPKRTG